MGLVVHERGQQLGGVLIEGALLLLSRKIRLRKPSGERNWEKGWRCWVGVSGWLLSRERGRRVAGRGEGVQQQQQQ